jgi:hypothetical protein
VLRILRAAADRGEATPEAVTERIAVLGPRLVISEHTETGTIPHSEIEAIVSEVLMPLITPRTA